MPGFTSVCKPVAAALFGAERGSGLRPVSLFRCELGLRRKRSR